MLKVINPTIFNNKSPTNSNKYLARAIPITQTQTQRATGSEFSMINLKTKTKKLLLS